jgi:hypothetical protein
MWTKFRDGGGGDDDDINEVYMWLWKTPQNFYKPGKQTLVS